MTAITSSNNPRLKELRKLHRARERARSGRFLAEGEDLLLAAQLAGRVAIEGFRTPGVDAGDASFHEVTPEALAAVSTLGSGTRAIGVYEQRYGEPTGPLCVYLHGVSDPGNVGTVLRSALAFGASCVALGPGCADPHSPKAVRASMGAIFAVPLARVADVNELPGERLALVAHTGDPLSKVVEDVDPRETPPTHGTHSAEEPSQRHGGRSETPLVGAERDRLSRNPSGTTAMLPVGAEGDRLARDIRRHHGGRSVTLLVGAEREGLPVDIIEACERVAHIPIGSDSLNAAMATTVALYEMTRGSTRVPTS
jgi:RNA methyltransferase, TrmH family